MAGRVTEKSASGLQIGQRFREILARNKALFNTYIIGEEDNPR
jgi:vancomycin permeability regulator SanA